MLPRVRFNSCESSLVFVFLIFGLFNTNDGAHDDIFQVALNEDSSSVLNWAIDYNRETLIFEIHIPSEYSWFAIGFSDRGEQFPADYCILWRDIKNKLHFQDIWADDSGVIHSDTQEDCEDFKIVTRKDVTKFVFTRKFDTCDEHDYIIEEGTTHIVWAKGNQKLFRVDGFNVSSPESEHGMVRVQLLKNTKASSSLPHHVRTVDFLVDKVQVPPEETTYWCHVFKLGEELNKKHHVYQFESHIQEGHEGLVHHMELFHCETSVEKEIPLYAGSCFAKDRPEATQVCKRVLSAWAMGAAPFTYPEEAGLPIGGENFNPYVMVEVHYNNPEKKSGFVDSSGIRLHISDILKDTDAAVLELGLEYTDKMAIPPGQESFPLIGYCVSECTAVGLPSEGITIFGSQLHTHLTGITVYTRHIRFGTELNELNRDNHFSTHFQEIRRLKRPVKVLPGDALITRCNYNTENRPNVTLGGFAISDEMCVNYIHYFPAAPLEVCKSAISDQALNTYFRYMNEWEGQSTSPQNGVSTNYKAIEWNKMRVQLLSEVYNEAPLSMQCNMSSGDRFPGYWENTPVTSVLHPLPPKPRNCNTFD